MQLSQWITPENLTVECDPYLMKIVMINLISNACKYGDKGSEIRVRVEKLEKAFTVSVWNEGPGFPPDLHSQLFKKFSRLQTPDLANKKGTGVGLYNVNRIIQLHGGLINARSTPGACRPAD